MVGRFLTLSIPGRKGGESPIWLWTFIIFLIFNQTLPNFAILSKIYLGMIWYDRVFCPKLDVAMTTALCQTCFSDILEKFWNPRWRIFGHHGVMTSRDMTSSPHVTYVQKTDFWAYYVPSKFDCHCLNIVEVTERGRNHPPPPLQPPPPVRKDPKKPGLNSVKKILWYQWSCSTAKWKAWLGDGM